MELVKIVVTVPRTHAEIVRAAAGGAGAGRIGNYRDCSFTVSGVGRFLPTEGAHPTIGAVGKEEEVEEDRIEWTVEKTCMAEVIAAIRSVHPYEEPTIDVYLLG